MGHSKRKRIIDETLLESVRKLPCLACIGGYVDARSYSGRVHPHHLISVKAGGPDIATNVAPLCPDHHRKIHEIGITEASKKWPVFRNWLDAAGWEYDTFRRKFTPPFQWGTECSDTTLTE